MPSSKSGGPKVKAAPAPPAIYGTDGDDEITLTSVIGPTTAGDDVVWAGLGNDTIDGGGGNDELHGEGGDDVVIGGDGNDTLYGDAGVDILDGGNGSDTLYGGDGNDFLIGGTGDDFIYGGAGDDTIFDDAGSDTIDGGDGEFDEVIYYGTAGAVGETGVDYTWEETTVVTGHGKNAVETTVIYVYAQDGSGDVDTITNVEAVLFLPVPDQAFVTQGDGVITHYDTPVNFDVLANDYIPGMDFGVGLTLTGILDIQIDFNGDGINDYDLIPDGVDLGYFSDGDGGILNDGSILTLNPDGTLTWDPNGVYDTPPADGSWPVLEFWYEASDGVDTEYGDVTIVVSYPAPTGDIQFENMTLDPVAAFLGLTIYDDGPDNSYYVAQLTTATGTTEARDVSVTDGNYDYDGDGDAEFRVWTDPDGTTHEMNVASSTGDNFNLQSLTFSGVDAGDSVTIEYWDYSGTTLLGTDTVAVDSLLSEDGVHYVYYTNETDIGQVSVIADAGDSVFVDDLVLV